MLLNVPNGPVTNGVMTYAAPSEGNSVTDHGYDERLSLHVMPDSVTTHVTPDTNGSIPLNGHSTQEHCNSGSLSVTGASTEEESNLQEQQLGVERCETITSKDEGHVEQEEAPKRDSTDGVPEDVATGIPAEQKETTSREEVEQVATSEQSKS